METDPQKESLAEIPLLGGQLTPDIVRVGNTVRRFPKGNTAFVHNLLVFLEEQAHGMRNELATWKEIPVFQRDPSQALEV